MLRKPPSSLSDHVPTLGDPPGGETGEQIDVLDYLRVLWRRRAVILIAMAACASLGAGWSLLSPRQFEAVLLLSVNQRTGENTLTAVATLAQSQAVLGEVFEAFKLAEPPYKYSLQQFRNQAVMVSPVPNTGFIRVILTLPDADLAARVANAVGQRTQEAAQSVSQLELNRLREQLKGPLDEATERLKAAQAKHQEFQTEAQIDLLRRDVWTLLDQRGELRRSLVDIESQRSRIAQLEDQIRSRRPLGALTQRLEENPTLLEAARAPGREPSELLGLQMESQYVDEVFQKLDAELALRRADLAALEAEQKTLVTAERLDKGDLAKLSELYRREAILAQLELEQELAQKAYSEAAARYQGTTLAVANQALHLQIAGPAVPPDESRPRLMSRNAVFGAFLGLIIGCFVAVLPLAVGQGTGSPTMRPRRFGI